MLQHGSELMQCLFLPDLPIEHNLVGGLEHFFPYIGNLIIPIDDFFFFRGLGLNHQPFKCRVCMFVGKKGRGCKMLVLTMAVLLIFLFFPGSSNSTCQKLGDHSLFSIQVKRIILIDGYIIYIYIILYRD